MESVVLFRDNQEVQADDLNNIETWVTQSLDDIVGDAIESGNAYTGLAITETAQTQISIGPGRLYWGGQVFAIDTPTVIDFFNLLPVTQNKQCAVVAWGQTVQTDVQPRNFIIDADTGQSQPQSVAMEQDRVCNLSTVNGVEAPSPTYPPTAATTLLIGYVLLNPTGIVSYQQVTSTQLDSIQDLAQRMTAVESFETLVEGQVNTLATALSALAAQLQNYTLASDFQKLVTLVNLIYAKLMALPPPVSPFIWYGTDNFLDQTMSQPSANVDGLYNAQVNEGCRFPGSTATTVLAPGLALLNPVDPSVVVGTDGFVLPTPSGSRVRMDCSYPTFDWLEDKILQYQYKTFSVRCLTRSRHRYCCGPHYSVCPQSQVWWYQAQLDPSTHILSFASESWETTEWSEIVDHANEDDVDWPQHQWQRNQYFWHDNVDMPYWSKVNTSYSHSGNFIAQSFLNAQDGWLTGVSLFLTQAYYQPLTLMIVACDGTGTPDRTQVLCRLNLVGTDIQNGVDVPILVGDIDQPASNWGAPGGLDPTIPVYIYPCRITIPPTFLEGGRRYAIHVVTTYDHRFSYSDRFECFAIHQGAFWYSGSDADMDQWTVGNKSLRFQLHYAVWQQWQGNSISTQPGPISVNLQAVQLAGGIGSMEILAESVVPLATNLTYQVQIGGVWESFGPDPNEPDFDSDPPLLPFCIVFTGTTDMMPGVSLTNSQVTLVGGVGGTLHQIETAITLGGNASTFKVIGMVDDFVSDNHTLTCSLHYGSTHNTSPSVSDIVHVDGTLERTWLFTGLSLTSANPITVEFDGTQNGVGDPFIIAQANFYAQT